MCSNSSSSAPVLLCYDLYVFHMRRYPRVRAVCIWAPLAVGVWSLSGFWGIVPIERFFKRYYPRDPSREELSYVSGFYGPGNYTAWLLTTYSTLWGSVNSTELVGLDGDFLAAIIYSIVASIHGICLAIKVPYSHDSFWAPFFVSYNGVLMLMVDFISEFPYPSHSEIGIRWIYIPRRMTRIRAASCGVAVIICVLAMTFTVHVGIRMWDHDRLTFPSIVVMPILFRAATGLHLFHPNVTLVMYGALHMTCTYVLLSTDWRAPTLVPPCGARFSDLDQAVTLSATAVTLACLWTKRIFMARAARHQANTDIELARPTTATMHSIDDPSSQVLRQLHATTTFLWAALWEGRLFPSAWSTGPN